MTKYVGSQHRFFETIVKKYLETELCDVNFAEFCVFAFEFKPKIFGQVVQLHQAAAAAAAVVVVVVLILGGFDGRGLVGVVVHAFAVQLRPEVES
jgi:hypothetical protein